MSKAVAASGAGAGARGPRRLLGHRALPPLIVGIYGITAICGMLDAASFLGLGHVFVEIMTGNLLYLGFAIGTHGSHHGGIIAASGLLPYASAILAFAVGAVAGGWFVRAGDRGRRWGFGLEWTAVGVALLLVVLTQPTATSESRYAVVTVLSAGMGLQNALVRRWGMPDLATNVMTLTLTGLIAESTIAGGTNRRWARRSTSIAIFLASAVLGAYLLRFGVVWPILSAFAIFTLTLPVLVQPADPPTAVPERNPPADPLPSRGAAGGAQPSS